MKGIFNFSLCLIKGISILALTGGSLFSFAYELRYNPSNPERPYIYDGELGSRYGLSRENMQGILLLMTDEPREFLRVFDYFRQYGPPIALDINYISKDGLKSTYLTRTTALKNFEIVDYLITLGINVNQPDGRDTTPIMYAAYCGHLPTVERLLAEGARLDFVDQDGDTALSSARKGQQRSRCPEGDYDGVIALLESIHEEQQQVTERGSDKLPNRFPEESNLNNPKYGAIAHKTDNPLIFVWNLGYSSREEARNDVVRKCNNINAQGRETAFSSCEFLVSFPTGRCVAYMVSSQEDEEALYESEGHHIIMAWGVGSSKRQAMDEALRKCDRPALKNECKVLISECQH